MSLLKRIEKGQSGNPSGGSSDNQAADGSRLSSLQARRVNAPITSPRAGSYFDLKTRVQNKLLSELGQLGCEDAILHAAPLSHGSGLYALPNVAKAANNVIVESRSFEPELVFRTIQQHRITNMFAAPTMVKLLVDHPGVAKYEIRSLKSLI